MVQRRPLVLSGNFAQEADNTDAVPLLGQITYGSGLFDLTYPLAADAPGDVYLAPEASGLIFVPDGAEQKLGDDGVTLNNAQSALLSGIAANEGVLPASASGLAAQRIAVEALASGNAALLNNENAHISSRLAVQRSLTAISSGNAAIIAADNALVQTGNAIASGEYALGICLEANAQAVGAQASGNAALYQLAVNPFIDENQLLGLIMALS